MSNLLNSYVSKKLREGGGTTGYDQDYVLNSHGDKILTTPDNNRILNSDGDFILQSPFTCRNPITNSDGGLILNDSGEPILDGGACKGKILTIGNKLVNA